VTLIKIRGYSIFLAYALEEKIRILEERVSALETALHLDELSEKESAELKRRKGQPEFIEWDEFWSGDIEEKSTNE